MICTPNKWARDLIWRFCTLVFKSLHHLTLFLQCLHLILHPRHRLASALPAEVLPHSRNEECRSTSQVSVCNAEKTLGDSNWWCHMAVGLYSLVHARFLESTIARDSMLMQSRRSNCSSSLTCWRRSKEINNSGRGTPHHHRPTDESCLQKSQPSLTLDDT